MLRAAGPPYSSIPNIHPACVLQQVNHMWPVQRARASTQGTRPALPSQLCHAGLTSFLHSTAGNQAQRVTEHLNTISSTIPAGRGGVWGLSALHWVKTAAHCGPLTHSFLADNLFPSKPGALHIVPTPTPIAPPLQPVIHAELAAWVPSCGPTSCWAPGTLDHRWQPVTSCSSTPARFRFHLAASEFERERCGRLHALHGAQH